MSDGSRRLATAALAAVIVAAGCARSEQVDVDYLMPLGPDPEVVLTRQASPGVRPAVATFGARAAIAWLAPTLDGKTVVQLVTSHDGGATFGPARAVAWIDRAENVRHLTVGMPGVGPGIVADTVLVRWSIVNGADRLMRCDPQPSSCAAMPPDATSTRVFDSNVHATELVDASEIEPLELPSLDELGQALNEHGAPIVVWRKSAAETGPVMLRQVLAGVERPRHALPATAISETPASGLPSVAALRGGVIVVWLSGGSPATVIARRIGLDTVCDPVPEGATSR